MATGAATRGKRPELPNTTFATSDSIDYYLFGSFSVDGAEVFRLPLDAINTTKLCGVYEQAPHYRSHETILDTIVRRAWQVDASKVYFPNNPHFLTTIQKIADTVVKKLEGHNEVQVEARLYKLLFYEVGGHFKMHQDTETFQDAPGHARHVCHSDCAAAHGGGLQRWQTSSPPGNML